MSEELRKAAEEYCKGTIFTDETGNDEALIYNMRFMAFHAGADSERKRIERAVLTECVYPVIGLATDKLLKIIRGEFPAPPPLEGGKE